MATPTNLPAAFTAGQVLTNTQMNNLRGAFRILQVVFASTTTPVTNNTVTPADTGLTATITPTSNTSKVLVIVNQAGGAKSGGNVANALKVHLLRGATNISNLTLSAGYTNTLVEVRTGTISTAYLDSPATTSATTYKTQFYNNIGAASVSVQITSEMSTMILMEVSA